MIKPLADYLTSSERLDFSHEIKRKLKANLYNYQLQLQKINYRIKHLDVKGMRIARAIDIIVKRCMK